METTAPLSCNLQKDELLQNKTLGKVKQKAHNTKVNHVNNKKKKWLF